MKSTLIYPLFPEQQVYDAGTTEFRSWPVARHEVSTFMEAIASEVSNLCLSNQKMLNAQEFKVSFPFFLQHAVTLFHWNLVFSRIRSTGQEVDIPIGMKTLSAIAANQELPLPSFLNVLITAFPSRGLSHYVNKALRPKKINKHSGRVNQNAVAVKVLEGAERVDYPRIRSAKFFHRFAPFAILATTRGDLLRRHAQLADGRVLYTTHRHWFHPLAEQRVRSLSECLASEMPDAAMDILKKHFIQLGDGSFPDHCRISIDRCLRMFMAGVGIHMERLRHRGRALPRELWTGSGGNLWDRMLRTVVRERGGQVVGHDHAGGVSWMSWPLNFMNEFYACDRYVTYNERHAGHIRQTGKLVSPLEQGGGEILSCADKRLLEVGEHPGSKCRRSKKKIMYVGGLYRGEQLSLTPMFPALAMSDWEVRLFIALTKEGHQVLYKPHPSDQVGIPSKVLASLGVQKITGNFETVIGMADVCMFMTAASTTFSSALSTTVPIVLLDFKQFEWYPEARELAARRCVLVQGDFDESNRMVADFNEVLAAVKSAPDLAHDRAFIDAYY